MPGDGPRTRVACHRIMRRLGPLAGAPLLLPAVVAGAPLWSVSALTRLLSRWRLLEPRSFPDAIVEYAPVVGARPRPNLDTYGRAQDVFRLTTDADGWRGSATLDAAQVVVFGDSFAFGYGVDDDDLYAEAIADVAVKPIASPAYSMVHAVVWMRRLAARLRGKAVVWLVHCGNDLADNLEPNVGSYRMPFVRRRSDGSWEVASGHVSPEPWTFETPPRPHAELLTRFATPSPYSDRVFAAADFLVGEASRVCAAAAARLTVVSVPMTMQIVAPAELRAGAHDPDRLDLALPDRRLADSCACHGVGFVPLRPHLRRDHYWEEDMHWNPAGHRLVADVVARIHERRMPR